MTQTKAGIRIEDLHLSFGDTKVLEGIDMVIEPGEFFAFLGPSGSGKSTLLRAIAGFGPTPRGRILIGDRDIANLPPWRRNVGMVFQSYALWPHMSVRRNVAFGLEERRLPAREIGPKVERALEIVGLLHLADRMPAQLSGGQQQRVALARTIAIEPQVLLLDEPLSNLDAALRVQMRRELLALQRKLGLTTIFVTHDQEEANTTSDRMAVLDKGVIQQIGTPQHLYDQPANAFVAGFLGTANILKGALQGAEFVTAGGQHLPVAAMVKGANCIVLRPQNIHISMSDGTIAGRVAHREFLGSQIRYLVDTADGKIIVDTLHSSGRPPYDEGAPVSLAIDSQNAPLLVA
ncbi:MULTISPECIES: ABC transporter ATP-binding protein [Paracoccus]|uniref:ABC transporter ATP-binding protein n=1 Tax=Paracoccus kondratievae TaxID=135740 RepID=A0AAD3NZG2_9RHOB|nr:MULTISPECIES: ABC transporter ATP-binding protein [Paracoccus]GLK64719.1 ABC transporter ATP-binding protein [Paracoccus kondratievae]SMG47828.1 iron(III) transport system ATP-binding protein [Paracoccus sp. J56]